MRAILLVGFMGSGKTSVGRALANQLRWHFEDLDDRIESREGKTVAQIFRDSGEHEFRRVEATILRELLQHSKDGKVVALGGGTFAQPENHAAIQSAGVCTVFLDAPLPELWRRCEEQTAPKRPLQVSKNMFRETYRARLTYYRTAFLTVDTAGKRIEAVAAEITAALRLGDK